MLNKPLVWCDPNLSPPNLHWNLPASNGRNWMEFVCISELTWLSWCMGFRLLHKLLLSQMYCELFFASNLFLCLSLVLRRFWFFDVTFWPEYHRDTWLVSNFCLLFKKDSLFWSDRDLTKMQWATATLDTQVYWVHLDPVFSSLGILRLYNVH